MTKRSSLGAELDKMYWKANSSKYDWRQNVEDFINILCFRLGISPINLSICTISNAEKCRARHGGKNPCGGACYQRNTIGGRSTIMVRNLFDFSLNTLLHELLHHISAENKDEAIMAIMWAWYKEFYVKHTGYRKFIREATKNEKKK